MRPLHFDSFTLNASPHAGLACACLQAGLDAADPYRAVRHALTPTRLAHLPPFENVWGIGLGKAGVPMAEAAAAVFGEHIAGGIIVVKDGCADGKEAIGQMRVVESGHPLPDARSQAAGHAMLQLLAQARPADLALLLISGGGSALVCAPAPGVTLAELQTLTAALLGCGADIHAINTLRKHLDQVKGGRLAQITPAPILALALSDVVGDALDVIASGPAYPDPTTYADAWTIIEQYGLGETLPPGIRAHLEKGRRGEIAETPKPDDPLFDRVQHVLVGSGQQAAQAMAKTARQAGWHIWLEPETLTGEARLQGARLAALCQDIAHGRGPVQPPACLIAAGETTVTLRGAGRGGRNQELALAAVETLAGLQDTLFLTLATDGSDGPTDAAGAVVSGTTLERATARGLDPAAFLAQNDAYSFFAELGDLLRPGPTLTNVNDLVLALIPAQAPA